MSEDQSTHQNREAASFSGWIALLSKLSTMRTNLSRGSQQRPARRPPGAAEIHPEAAHNVLDGMHQRTSLPLRDQARLIGAKDGPSGTVGIARHPPHPLDDFLVEGGVFGTGHPRQLSPMFEEPALKDGVTLGRPVATNAYHYMSSLQSPSHIAPWSGQYAIPATGTLLIDSASCQPPQNLEKFNGVALYDVGSAGGADSLNLENIILASLRGARCSLRGGPATSPGSSKAPVSLPATASLQSPAQIRGRKDPFFEDLTKC